MLEKSANEDVLSRVAYLSRFWGGC